MSLSKREQLLQGALEIFNSEGFHAVGMDRLAKQVGVSKTAIYKHFKTKDELILATLRLQDEQFRNWLMRRVEQIAATPRDKLKVFFDVFADWLSEPQYQGCMFVKASSEFQSREHMVHQLAAEHKRLMLNYLRQLVKELDLPETEEAVISLSLIVEGALVLAHLHEPKVVAENARRAAEKIIGISLQS